MSFSHPCITLASGSKQTAGVFIPFPENQLLRYKYCLVDDLVNFGYKQQRGTFFQVLILSSSTVMMCLLNCVHIY